MRRVVVGGLGGLLWMACGSSPKPGVDGAAGAGGKGSGGSAGAATDAADRPADLALDAPDANGRPDVPGDAADRPADLALDAPDDGDRAPDVATPAGPSASVLERNKNPSRDGHFIEPTLTRRAAATMTLDAAFNATFTGAMYASPLYLENGPGGKGVFFAVTTGNNVFALYEKTGAVVWTKSIGPAPPNTGVPCGNVHPIGILSTPVIDSETRTIFVAGAVGTTIIERHEIHALSVDDGSERKGWPLDVSTLKSGAVPFSAPPQNQRGSLSLVNGILYVPYGGHAGDCGPYRGWVVAVDAHDPTKAGAWATGGFGEGIWASGGMASDGNGVFAATGNGLSANVSHLDSEALVRITGLGTLDRTTNQNVYFPAVWRTLDVADADFGSNSPVYFEVPGATPRGFVAVVAKTGHLYLLDSKNLGGMGGEIVDAPISTRAFVALASYRTAQGVHVAMYAGGVACPNRAPDGGALEGGIVSVLIPPGAPPVPRPAWCADSLGSGSPIATTTDGESEPIVWFMSGGKLNGVDGDTGASVSDGGPGSCAGVRPRTSPIAVKGRIVAGADGRLCAWSPR